MTEDLQKHEGFLELISTVDTKVKKKLLGKATDEEVEAVLDCFNNFESYTYRLKKACRSKFLQFKKAFKRKNFTLKKARVLFLKNLDLVTSVVATILSEILDRKISTFLACHDVSQSVEGNAFE